MIIATSQTQAYDSFPILQALMGMLGYYRNIEDQVVANNELNILVKEQCGEQLRKYRFGGARLEADVNPAYPESIPTGMRLSFLMKYDGANGYEQIQLFHVTADDQGKLKGELVAKD